MSNRMKKTTINDYEINKFNKIAEEWWDPNGKFKPLHKFNPVRINYIKDSLQKYFKIKDKFKPLKGLNILDIGCGGGLLCEPISRLGANVVGIDASERNIKIAHSHLKKSNLNIKYFKTSPENFSSNTKFDVVLNMEIVEHVNDISLFLKHSSKFLNKKKGVMFVATINKTLKSYFYAIIGAEYILRWLPIGTHDWENFVEPKKLIELNKKNSLKLRNIHGVKFDVLQNIWKISNDKSVNYISEFHKV